MNAVQPILSGMTSYYEAQSNYEQAVTTKEKYDKLISAAGNNTKKTQKLEQKQKELARD